MKGLLIPTAVAAAAIAITATVATKVAEATANRSKLLDLVTSAYTNYRARREYLRTCNPHAKELEDGKKMLDDLIKVVNECGEEEEDAKRRLESVRENINSVLSQAQQSRADCLTDKYNFDGDSVEFLSEISGYDVDQLASTLRQIREATNEVDHCIKRIESATKSYLFEYWCIGRLSKYFDSKAKKNDNNDGQ